MTDFSLHWVDFLIIAAYLALTMVIGVIAERKASAGAGAFFLGDNKLPWWALGASGMASNVDISGTTLAVGLIYALGMSGFFVEIRGGIVLVMAIFLAFMGKWNRRSGAMTTAEWMTFRFGARPEGRFARIISASAEVLGTVPIIAYFTVGLITFVGPLLPSVDPVLTSCLLILFILIYSTVGGFVGVVWTDVFQGGVIMLGVLYICVLGITAPALPERFNVSVPLKPDSTGQVQYTVIEHQAIEWSSPVPPREKDIPGAYSNYNQLWKVIGVFILLTVVAGSSGGGGYMAQRYLAAKNEREAGLLSAFWIALLALRWPMVISFAVLGIHYGLENGGIPIQNPEAVLPTVLAKVVPTGMKGLLVACFLAAFMSTFSAFINATSAYWSNDLYKNLFNPNASQRRLVWHGRLASVVIVVLGVIFALFLTDINSIWEWLVGGLGAGLAIPMLLRWYWWRFNGWGFAVGTLTGMIGAFIIQAMNLGWAGEKIFAVNGSATLVAAVVAALCSTPADREVLLNFYRKTRPFGFWGPVRRQLSAEEQRGIVRENVSEVLSAMVAIPLQLCLFLLPMTLVLRSWGHSAALAGIVAVLGVALYFTWYRNLSKET